MKSILRRRPVAQRTTFKLAMAAMLLTMALPALASACASPKSIGGWIGGSGDDVTNEITSITSLDAESGIELGWFYRLVNGDTFFQPALVVLKETTTTSTTTRLVAGLRKNGAPAVRITARSSAQAAKAIATIAGMYGVTPDDIAQPWLALMHGRTRTVVVDCK